MWPNLKRCRRLRWTRLGVIASLIGRLPMGESASGPPPPPPPPRPPTNVAECATPQPAWIWCDDFEQDRLNRYFEYDNANGSFVRAAKMGVGGSYGMRARFNKGQVDAGSL